MKKIFLTLLFSLFFCLLNAQQAKIDSLFSEYSKTSIDTIKVNLLLKLYVEYSNFNAAKGIGSLRDALELSNRINYKKGICKSNTFLGDYYYDQISYSDALKHYLKASMAGEDEKMYNQLSNIYNKIGIIYSNQKKNDLSLKYFLKVAKLAEIQNKPKRIAIAYNNIGIAYKDLGRYAEAKKYYEKALVEFEKSDFKVGIASVNNGLGILSHLLGDEKRALEYYDKAMENFRAINDTASESGILTNIGEVLNAQKEYAKALSYYLKSLKVAEHYNNNSFRANAYEGLSNVYANMKNYERAYYYRNRHLALRDSIEDSEGMRQFHEMEKRLENEKQEKEILLLKQKEEIQELKVKSQSEKINRGNIIIYSVAGVLIIVLVMSFFIYKAYKQIKKTNIELAEKKQEIQDSINYARHIQNAMLPEVNVLEKHFPEGFGLFLPKDIVSGDFYWFNELNNIVYFAAADCTGHGVPGAFMSMIAIDKLNQCLIDKKIDSPAAILSYLNKSIKKALKQDNLGSLSKDGLDIALCSFDKNKFELNYSGANRPLWIIRNKELIEYKPTKVSIAGFTNEDQKFDNHFIKLRKGDSIILFSDGFADQFGGEQKKKFMTKRLKELLININDLPMGKQELELEQIFNTWKGNLEQVDDVMILGFRV